MEDVLEARPPGVMPDVFEGCHCSSGDEGAGFLWRGFKDVEPDGVRGVGRIEVDDVVGAVSGNVMEQLFGKVAMGINERDTMAMPDVLHEKVQEKRALPSASLSDAIHMMSAVGELDAEALLMVAVVGASEVCDWSVVVGHKASCPSARYAG